MRIRPTQHERNEWARMAQDCYKHGKNAYGHRYSSYAALHNDATLPVTVFDALQINYRVWLLNGAKSLA